MPLALARIVVGHDLPALRLYFFDQLPQRIKVDVGIVDGGYDGAAQPKVRAAGLESTQVIQDALVADAGKPPVLGAVGVFDVIEEKINTNRLSYAAELFLGGELTPLAACEKAGFNNLSHFYHLFKEQYGCAPGQFVARYASMEGQPLRISQSIEQTYTDPTKTS